MDFAKQQQESFLQAVVGHLEARPACVGRGFADGEGVAAEHFFPVLLVDGNQFFQFFPAFCVQKLRALEEYGDKGEPHGETVIVAMERRIAVSCVGPFGILQQHLQLVAVEIFGHEPVLAQHVIRHHNQMLRQCFLDVLEVNAAIFLGIVPSVSGVGIFRAKGELGLHPGSLHDFADIPEPVFKGGAIVQMVEIDFPGNDFRVFQIFQQVLLLCSLYGYPESEFQMIFLAGGQDVFPLVGIAGEKHLVFSFPRIDLPAVVDAEHVDAEVCQEGDFLQQVTFSGKLAAAGIGRPPGVIDNHDVALGKDRIACPVKAFQRQLHPVVSAVEEQGPGGPAFAESVADDFVGLESPAGDFESVGPCVEASGVMSLLVDAFVGFLDDDDPVFALFAIFGADAAGPVYVFILEERVTGDNFLLQHVFALVVPGARVVIVSPVAAAVLPAVVEWKIFGACAGHGHGVAIIVLGGFSLRQTFGTEVFEGLYPQLGAYARTVRKHPDDVLQFDAGRVVTEMGHNFEKVVDEAVIVGTAYADGKQLAFCVGTDGSRQVPVGCNMVGGPAIFLTVGKVFERYGA